VRGRSAAPYLWVDPARLRRFVNEIDRSLLEDIERIEAALAAYAQDVQAGRVVPHPARQRDLHPRSQRTRIKLRVSVYSCAHRIMTPCSCNKRSSFRSEMAVILARHRLLGPLTPQR
jgi:hypothetical protein